MNALLLALLLSAGPAPAAPPEGDLHCYRLMAELARADDPAVRRLGLAAAQFFLGRIDAAAPGTDLTAIAAPAAEERPALVRRCAEALGAGGFDPGALGASLASSSTT